MEIQKIFEGAVGKRGLFTGYTKTKEGKEKKEAVEQTQHINWDDHLSGRNTQGLSPVKIIKSEEGSKGLVRWIALDVDVNVAPKKFCAQVFKIHNELIPISSTSGRWHVYLFLDDWTDVSKAKELVEKLEKKFEKIYGKDVDKTHTLPKGWTVEEDKPGCWMFMPYSYNKDLKNIAVAYSPSGNPLSKEQFEFRVKYKKHPLISSSVSFSSPGRHKLLFNCALYLKHNDMSMDILKEVNQNFNDVVDERELAG